MEVASLGPEMAGPEEEAALEALKDELAKTPEDLPGRNWLVNVADDLTYLRFLRGHQLKVKKSLKLLKHCAKWRVEFGTDEILETWPQNKSFGAQLVRKHWPMAVTGKDFAQRPIHYFHISLVDFPALIKNAGMANLVRHNVFLMETALRANPRGEAIMIVDLGSDQGRTAFSIASATRWLQSVVLFVKAMAKIADPFYPESYHRIYFTRVHAIFERMYKSMSGNLNEATLSKVQVLQKTDILATLMEDMPKESIPPTLGGDSQASIAKGGYITDEDIAEARALADESGQGDQEEDVPVHVELDAELDAEEDCFDGDSDTSKRMSLRKSLSRRLSRLSSRSSGKTK
ncbi:SEC14 cytosolic factor [Hondaea fermentalgiana]|uniref:SEC14 cytosolic factor n=1 Tax=Hondaea fermentalgiana TaxID=2315210 RepID=A0A2R5G9W8_9STRA|nr:SEC14 cytosolic factor [Hondaea fermentalgiana]|eukprot:GBG25333.1 SEC14 cytosolic factor [Hondaea fermentalgiana]